MATAPNQGIMALPENQEMQAPQLSLMDSYEAMQQGLQNARPDASMELEEMLAEIRPELDELGDEQLALLIQGVEGLYGDPKNYTKEVADLVKDDLIDEGDFPAEYDEEFLAAFLMVLIDTQRSRMASAGASQTMPMPESSMGMAPMGMAPPQGFARGGIAEAARMVANRGRYGDTMLAHITPEEARLLRARGGSGTINPETGLPEFFLKKLFKSIKKFVKSVGQAVKKALSSPIGRILGTIALGMILGPAVASFLPGLSAAAAAGVTGALASGGVTALSGGDLKSVLTSAATGFLGAPGGPVGNFIGKYTAAVGVTNAAANAALTGAIVGTGSGLVSGQSLKESLKSGLVEGAISGGTALMSGAPKVDVDNAATTAARDAVESGRVLPDVDSKALDVETQNTVNKFKGLDQPDMIGTGAQRAGATPKYLPQGDGSYIDTFTNQYVSPDQAKQLGLGPKPYLEVEPPKNIFAQTPGMSPSEFASQNLDAAKAQIIPRGQLANLNEPPTNIFAQGPGMSQADYARKLAEADAASFNSFQDLTSTGQAKRDLSQQTMGLYDRGRAAPQVTAGMPNAPAPYRQVGIMESLGEMGSGAKKFLTGDFSKGASQLAEGAGNLFAPGPSSEQVAKFMEANNMPKTPGSYDEALKLMGAPTGFTGALRTYGPTAAAGIGALALTGGFEPNVPEESEFAEQMRSRPIDLSGDPSRYYIQGLPGVQYDERGTIIGSTAPPVGQTMQDIRVAGRSYRGYPPPPMFMNQGGAVQGKSYISNRSIDYGDPYAVQAPMPTVNRYYPLVSNTPAPKKRYAGQARTIEEMRQDLQAGRYSQSRFVPRNTSVVAGKSLLPSPAPARMNVGGIAALTQGGYPRRTGQISGPGTEKSDSIPAMLSDGEFVMTAKAVRGAGGGSRREGAKRMYALMNQLERNAARG